MATTTNYSWTTPDDTDLVKDGAAAIRTLGSSVDTTTKALNPSTTLGDIEYRSSTANTNTRLGLGTAGQVLTVNSGATAPEWATPAAGGGMTLLSTTTLATGTTTISGISGSYKHLFLIVKNVYLSGSGEQVYLRMNGDSGNNYAFGRVETVGTSVAGAGSAATSEVILSRSTNSSAAKNMGQYQISIPRYTDTNQVSFFCDLYSSDSTTYFSRTLNGVYDCSAAITSISLVTSLGTFSGGTAYLYGVN